MQRILLRSSGAVAAAVLFALASSPLKAADPSGVRPVAEELEKRAVAAEDSGTAQKGMSDSSVRVMTSYAWSFLPAELPGPDGKPVKIDKTNPTKYLIPIDDARRVIRVATRSAYAEACNLPDLQTLNFETMIKTEAARKVWSQDQMMFINFLHFFATTYLAGNAKFKVADETDKAPAPQEGQNATPPAANGGAAQSADASGDAGFAQKKPDCTPEKKEKVTQAINAYVEAAKAAPAAPAPQPAPTTTTPPKSAPAPTTAAPAPAKPN